MAEGVTGEAGLPLAGQGDAGGQLADGVGGLGTAAVAPQGDEKAAGFEDVDVGAAMGGVGVGAAAGVPRADADIRQQAGASAMAQRLGALGALRAGTTSERAAAVYSMMTSPASWLQLTQRAGWTFDESEAWLTESLTQLLLEPSL